MENLIGTTNANFVIFRQGKYAVMAVRPSDSMYVSWSYGAGGFFWGHYGSFEHALAKYTETEDRT